MKNHSYKLLLIAILLMAISCKNNENNTSDFIGENIQFASDQVQLQIDEIEKSGKILNPRTVENGAVKYTGIKSWTSGFFPGTLWLMYELTNDTSWKDYAVKHTQTLDTIQYFTEHHDIGFMIECSYGNGLRIEDNLAYKKVIVQAAKSLSTRFRPNAGILQSWNVDGGWMSKRGWECPVIIDNMMNLELLFNASKISGDTSFYDIAVSHADKTIENHYRKDNSSYHVVDYSTSDGAVRSKETAQGFAHESAWARGQAWGVYGFTVCYRETKNPKYLLQAQKAVDFVLTHPNLPKDLVPYWDFNADKIPNEPRDASSAAILASALYELSTYDENSGYKETADKIMTSLASSAYRAKSGQNGNFILKHSVGSIPHGAEIDVPLSYADYYFLEALSRKRSLEE